MKKCLLNSSSLLYLDFALPAPILVFVLFPLAIFTFSLNKVFSTIAGLLVVFLPPAVVLLIRCTQNLICIFICIRKDFKFLIRKVCQMTADEESAVPEGRKSSISAEKALTPLTEYIQNGLLG